MYNIIYETNCQSRFDAHNFSWVFFGHRQGLGEAFPPPMYPYPQALGAVVLSGLGRETGLALGGHSLESHQGQSWGWEILKLAADPQMGMKGPWCMSQRAEAVGCLPEGVGWKVRKRAGEVSRGQDKALTQKSPCTIVQALGNHGRPGSMGDSTLWGWLGHLIAFHSLARSLEVWSSCDRAWWEGLG